jgi:hypothetical protein
MSIQTVSAKLTEAGVKHVVVIAAGDEKFAIVNNKTFEKVSKWYSRSEITKVLLDHKKADSKEALNLESVSERTWKKMQKEHKNNISRRK